MEENGQCNELKFTETFNIIANCHSMWNSLNWPNNLHTAGQSQCCSWDAGNLTQYSRLSSCIKAECEIFGAQNFWIFSQNVGERNKGRSVFSAYFSITFERRQMGRKWSRELGQPKSIFFSFSFGHFPFISKGKMKNSKGLESSSEKKLRILRPRLAIFTAQLAVVQLCTIMADTKMNKLLSHSSPSSENALCNSFFFCRAIRFLVERVRERDCEPELAESSSRLTSGECTLEF